MITETSKKFLYQIIFFFFIKASGFETFFVMAFFSKILPEKSVEILFLIFFLKQFQILENSLKYFLNFVKMKFSTEELFTRNISPRQKNSWESHYFNRK